MRIGEGHLGLGGGAYNICGSGVTYMQPSHWVRRQHGSLTEEGLGRG